MQGLLVEICPNQPYDIVDTRNDRYGRLRLYYNKLAIELATNMTVEFEINTSSSGNTYAKFIFIVERNQAIFNTEDRDRWYEWGEAGEDNFIANIAPVIGLDIRKNPAKATCPWEIDLVDYTNNRYADLKIQNTPFFTVGKYSYNGQRCNPTYSVTFNHKDFVKYSNEHPDCDIYFWVTWNQTEYQGNTIPELHGVWRGCFARMAERITQGVAPLHAYQHRTTDDHNARDSYVFDLRDTYVFEHLL